MMELQGEHEQQQFISTENDGKKVNKEATRELMENVLSPVEADKENAELPVVESDNGDETIERVEVVVTGVELDTTNHYGVVRQGAAMFLGSLPYVVELAVVYTSDFTSTYSTRRPLAQFLSTLTNITTPQTNPGDSRIAGNLSQYPEFPVKPNDITLTKWCTDVTQYVADMARNIASNHTWIDFVTDHERISERKGTQMTATSYILQPFPYEKIYVPRGSRHDVVVPVKSDEQFIVWRFDVEDHDIDFTVQFLPSGLTPSQQYERYGHNIDSNDLQVELQVIHATTRYVTTMNQRPVEGTYRCTGPGTATLVWDNSYSLLRGKNVHYQVQAVHMSIMDAATAAADAYDEAARAKLQRQQAIHDARRREIDGSITLSSNDKDSSRMSNSPYYLDVAPVHLYRQLFADTISSQSGWLLSTPLDVAGKLASRLFGSSQAPKIDAVIQFEGEDIDGTQLNVGDGGEHELSQQDQEAKSLLEELNGLNMQLLERLETCEDTIAKLAAERDQVQSKLHLALVDQENMVIDLGTKDAQLTSLREELQRFDREREAWSELQQERDELLEEKHRWAMMDDFIPDSHDPSLIGVDTEGKMNLERELGQAEVNVLRLRAELGYSLSNHLTGTSTRLEKIAREMNATKKQYEDQMKESEQEMAQLKQEITKYRSQKRVLIAEIKNIQTQSAGQVSVATAEANEARMVNRRLKKQNELLLTQIRTLVDDAREQEKVLQEQVEEKIRLAQKEVIRLSDDDTDIQNALLSKDHSRIRENHVMDGSTISYTLNEVDIALLNGQAESSDHVNDQRREVSLPSGYATQGSSHRERLVAFFEKNDPSKLGDVDSMLESYAGVESMLFDSLELKYSYFPMSESQ